MSSAAGVHFGNRLRAIRREEEAERRKFEELRSLIRQSDLEPRGAILI